MSNFLYITWDVSPFLFETSGSFALRWYSLMFVVAFALGLFVYRKIIVRENLPVTVADNVLLPVFLATLIGARLGHCLFYEPEYYLKHFGEIFIPFKDGKFVGYQGLASHGAAIAIPIGLYYYSKKNNLKYLWTLDRVVIVIALAGTFIRLGNLMNSEIYGHETSLPWGFIFVRAGETVPKHPTQIYEALSYFSIFIILMLVYLKKKPPFKDGVIFSFFLILVFSIRFIIEFLKETQVEFENNMILDMGQWLSIPLIIIGIILLVKINKKGGLTVKQ